MLEVVLGLRKTKVRIYDHPQRSWIAICSYDESILLFPEQSERAIAD